MKLDATTIPIEARNASGCLALAIRLCREDAPVLLRIVAPFAIVSTAFAWWASDATESGLLLSLALFHVVSPFCGAAIVAAEGPRAFGDPMSAGSAFRIVRAHLGRIALLLLPGRIITVLVWMFFAQIDSDARWALLLVLGVPLALLVTERSALVREVALLEQLVGARFSRRIADLRLGVSFELAKRHLGNAVSAGFSVLTLFVLLDLVATTCFSSPILFRRFPFEDLPRALPWVLTADPWFVSSVTALLWVLYPLVRVSSFLSYLDLRIRKECWDVELDFRIEARRLEELVS